MGLMPNFELLLIILFVLISTGLIIYFDYQVTSIKSAGKNPEQARKSLRRSIVCTLVGLPLLIGYLFMSFR